MYKLRILAFLILPPQVTFATLHTFPMSGRGRGFSHQSGQHGQRKGILPRDVVVRIADETLKAIEAGSYALHDPQAGPNYPAFAFDLRSNVESLKAYTTFYGDRSAMAAWLQSQPQESSNVRRPMKIWAMEKSTLETSRLLVEKLASEHRASTANIVPGSSRAHAIGVLNFASARHPGGGFMTGARAQEESIARSSTLYPSLTCPIGQQFYAHHRSKKNDGYYSHSMIYSPSVMVIRNDAGGWIRPFEIDILTSPAVNAGVVRQKRQQAIDQRQQTPYSEADMEEKIRSTMKERMGRLLYLFESQGTRNLVLGSFGTGAFRNNVDMVVEIWAELLLGECARFGKSFDRVVFGVIDNPTFVKFAGRFGTEPR